MSWGVLRDRWGLPEPAPPATSAPSVSARLGPHSPQHLIGCWGPPSNCRETLWPGKQSKFMTILRKIFFQILQWICFYQYAEKNNKFFLTWNHNFIFITYLFLFLFFFTFYSFFWDSFADLADPLCWDLPPWSPAQSVAAAGTAPVSAGAWTRTAQRHSLSHPAGPAA